MHGAHRITGLLHAPQQCMSGIGIFLRAQDLILNALSRDTPQSTKQRPLRTQAIADRFQINRRLRFIARCSLTLICSSLIQRLTLAAAFAAAFLCLLESERTRLTALLNPCRKFLYTKEFCWRSYPPSKAPTQQHLVTYGLLRLVNSNSAVT